ncbi:uncharacterized protein LOC117106840 [Anneissia japonica]|uniref:uncharacterized protein LOC117106840 n=1 Tax=Anneissia japonica TaxID=1529436 RepID=UPI0014259F8A|nr:uncharacterized protein LOC117106840 [Anneissia japonica]
MAEGISLKGIDNYGNTIDICGTNRNKQDTKLGTSSVYTGGIAAPSNNELKATPTSETGRHFKRNKYAYLVVIFAVSIFIASIVCACIVLFVGNRTTSIPPMDKNTLQCVNSTVLRLNAKEKITARHNNTRLENTLLQPVGCLHIPQGKCTGVLPYITTFIPNNHVDSFKTAENYLEEISGFLDCDTHALYVVCSWLYPPCITDTIQVVPCKAICEGVVNGCQEIFNITGIGSQISCEYSPAGETNEMVCKSCSYNVYLNVGEVFQFTSPNYPLAFFPNTYCVWLITSPPSTKIKFNITNVDLDYGNLKITFGQNPYESLFRLGFSDTVVTDDIEFFTYLNLASVIFKSPNKVNEKKGFTAVVRAIDIKDALYCDTHNTPKSLHEDELCDGQENCKDLGEDEYMCRKWGIENI